jgi:hypothetical protein
MDEINRARRGRPEISDGSPGIVIHAEPFGFYWVFLVIWVGLGDFREMMGTKVDFF